MIDPNGGSNIDEVESWEKDLIDSFDFTRPGEDQSLGRDMAADVATGIIDRTTAEQRDATGSPLKPNEPKYAKRKAEKYGAHQPLVRTGQLLSLQSVKGEVTVSPDEIVMRYGTGDAPSRSSTGYISDADRAVTDRQKAEWNSDERPFYAMDDAIIDAVAQRAADELAKVMNEKSQNA